MILDFNPEDFYKICRAKRRLCKDTDAGPGSVLNVPGMLGLHELAEPYKPKAGQEALVHSSVPWFRFVNVA